MLESDNTFRLYVDISKVEGAIDFRIDGERITIGRRADGMIYMALSTGVLSNHLQDEHVYSIASEGSEAQTITASVLTFARSCVTKKDEKTRNLGKALFLYNRAAVAAFGGE